LQSDSESSQRCGDQVETSRSALRSPLVEVALHISHSIIELNSVYVRWLDECDPLLIGDDDRDRHKLAPSHRVKIISILAFSHSRPVGDGMGKDNAHDTDRGFRCMQGLWFSELCSVLRKTLVVAGSKRVTEDACLDGSSSLRCVDNAHQWQRTDSTTYVFKISATS
jgi:hypothetical protein